MGCGVERGYDMVLLFITSDFIYNKQSLDLIASSIKGQIDDQDFLYSLSFLRTPQNL